VRALIAADVQLEAHLDKYIRALSSFRDDIRKLAIGGASSQDILALCDRFRDQDLVNLGVQLDDGQGAGQSHSACQTNTTDEQTEARCINSSTPQSLSDSEKRRRNKLPTKQPRKPQRQQQQKPSG